MGSDGFPSRTQVNDDRRPFGPAPGRVPTRVSEAVGTGRAVSLDERIENVWGERTPYPAGGGLLHSVFAGMSNGSPQTNFTPRDMRPAKNARWAASE